MRELLTTPLIVQCEHCKCFSNHFNKAVDCGFRNVFGHFFSRIKLIIVNYSDRYDRNTLEIDLNPATDNYFSFCLDPTFQPCAPNDTVLCMFPAYGKCLNAVNPLATKRHRDH